MKKINFAIILIVILCFTMGLTSFASEDVYREKVPRIIIEEMEEKGKQMLRFKRQL